nr:MAG TPA: hypothetical protein [Caudoviricetes sp.]
MQPIGASGRRFCFKSGLSHAYIFQTTRFPLSGRQGQVSRFRDALFTVTFIQPV